ncbi:hypothetical protein GCM10007079_14860 [Nocardiopsis terrae]|uniref:Uncharacterized protein n=1 Tax=Nocardiopsis terrae TaxID=372655 RepID=A0ABR9HBP1_9ACTN|nr:hypothetical protein [Nocardiopsis terrae]MBE1456311.1 hypothetical protein [Nocardiopsis terrae]GHC77563.1 hypothetical protein GCM10007079_14860 [Nocardiopsis terrae]
MQTPQKTLRRAANRSWFATVVLLVTLVGVWIAAGLATGVGELDERCSHGMVGPGGWHEVERSSYPPDITCVYPGGESVSSAGPLVFVWWACVVLVVVCALTAFALEFLGLTHEGFDGRFPVFAAAFPALLASLYACVLLLAFVPTLMDPNRCGLGTRYLNERARLHYEPFPQQVTCAGTASR